MRIALLAARSSTHTVRWANALAERNYAVHLISLHTGGDPLNERVIFHRLPIPAPLGYILNAPLLGRLLRNIQPDLLHTHYASGYGTLARLAGFHPHVLSVWGSDVYDFPAKSPFHRWLIRGNLRAADWVCSTSFTMAERTRCVYPVKNLSVTPFGIDTLQFRPRHGLRDRSVVMIGTVKTLAPKYGVDLLIRAFDLLRQQVDNSWKEKLRLLVVGGGPQEKELKQLVRELGLTSAVTFAGRVPHTAVPSYLNRLDIYVALSRSESFGVAVLEASACGLPVVVSDVGGLPEVVRHGETGFVVPRENVEAAAGALLRLVGDEQMRRRFGEAGRAHVIGNYSWIVSVDKMLAVYKRVLEGREGTQEIRHQVQ